MKFGKKNKCINVVIKKATSLHAGKCRATPWLADQIIAKPKQLRDPELKQSRIKIFRNLNIKRALGDGNFVLTHRLEKDFR